MFVPATMTVSSANEGITNFVTIFYNCYVNMKKNV